MLTNKVKLKKLTLLLVIMTSSVTAHASPDKAVYGTKGIAAFECAGFANSFDRSEEARLIGIGHKNLALFFAAWDAGEISEEEYQSVIRMDYSWKSVGPSDDFVIGRMYEWALSLSKHRVSHVSKPDGSIDRGKEIDDVNVIITNASRIYKSKNCSFIQ